MAHVPTRYAWRTSSYSGGGKECVEIADTSGATLVRDSMRPDRCVLAFTVREWRVFVASVRGEELGV